MKEIHAYSGVQQYLVRGYHLNCPHFQLGYVHYPTLMILIDFLPGIVTLGFVLAFKNECHPLLALAIVAHPLLLPGISVAEFLDRNGSVRKRRFQL